MAMKARGGKGGGTAEAFRAATPLGLENPSPISGKNGSRPEDGNYEDEPENGIFWAQAAERALHPVVEALVRLA
jgi:hypothetical protein